MIKYWNEHYHDTIYGKIVHTTVHTLLYIWQLPQNIVGLAMKLYFRGEKKILSQRNAVFYIAPTMSGGISFGRYIFLSEWTGIEEPVYDHEFGHVIQSRILGPLYLPIVGVCSGIHALTFSGKGNYYDFWTEKWANQLGGICGYTGEFKYHKPGAIYTTSQQLQSWYINYFNSKK